MAVGRAIAEFAAQASVADIPAEVVERGKGHILDCLGLALSGAAAEASALLRGHVESLGGTRGSTVMGAAMRTAPRFAAWLNATAMHADNFDDTNPQAAADRNGGIHASAPALAAAVAVGEPLGISGRSLMTAYHLGVEVACRLNHAIDARHYEGGFHATATLGTFGAAIAASRALGLDASATTHALAIAASMAAGVRANFGTMVETMHPGHAAECGVLAADLAARGVRGSPDALDGRSGYLAAAGGRIEAGALDRLGAPWAFIDPGMWIKPYPSGALTHPAMGCLLDLVRTHDLRPDLVRRVRLTTNRRIRDTLVHDRPDNALEAKFSLPFCLALVLHERRAGLAEFTDSTVARPDIRATMAKVDFGTYDRAAADYTNVTTLIEVELVDGRRLAARADHARGSARAPMSFDEIADKTRSCAASIAWPPLITERIIATVRDLEHVADIRNFLPLLAKA